MPLVPMQTSTSSEPFLPESLLDFEVLREDVLSDVDAFFMLNSCTTQQQHVYTSLVLVSVNRAHEIFRETVGQSNPAWHMYREVLSHSHC